MVEIRRPQFDVETGQIDPTTWPYLKCPANNNEPVLPIKCMFCPTGHMTECHYPETCSDGSCNHYGQDEDSEEHYYDDFDKSGDY